MVEDDDYFQQWYQMRTLNTGINGVCSGACKPEHLCELAAPTYAVFTQCVENNTPNATHALNARGRAPPKRSKEFQRNVCFSLSSSLVP